MVKRSGAARASRHSKKYMRKGTNVADFEQSIVNIGREKATGGLVENLTDDSLFTLDKAPKEVKEQLTRKQQAALNKITDNISKPLDVALPPAKAPKGKIAKLPRGNAILKREEKILKSKKAAAKSNRFDLWNTDFTPKVDLDNEAAADHFLRYTKQKQPNKPLKAVTSLLPAVSIAKPGASYNPEADEYVEYVNQVAKEEEKLMRQEEKQKNAMKPKDGVFATYRERELAAIEGLPGHPDFGKEEEEEEDAEPKEEFVKVLPQPLTKKERRKKEKAALLAKAEKKRLEKKARERDLQNVFKAKQINKELDKEDNQREKNALDRKRKKVMDKLTTRQKLGAGEFKDEEEPFLLQGELTGNLRQLKVQGSILEDRVKSMQKRNMLPIAGKKNHRRLKKSLKVKKIEKRSAKEITKGSKVF